MSSKPLNSREYQEQVAKAEEFKRRILTLYSAKKIQPSPSNFLGYVGTAVAIGSHLYLGPWDEVNEITSSSPILERPLHGREKAAKFLKWPILKMAPRP